MIPTSFECYVTEFVIIVCRYLETNPDVNLMYKRVNNFFNHSCKKIRKNLWSFVVIKKWCRDQWCCFTQNNKCFAFHVPLKRPINKILTKQLFFSDRPSIEKGSQNVLMSFPNVIVENTSIGNAFVGNSPLGKMLVFLKNASVVSFYLSYAEIGARFCLTANCHQRSNVTRRF